jgi:predicted PhzF superfamily epimerase YddE/YHI9
VATLHVLRVFVNDKRECGNHLGVFLDGHAVPAGRRQEIATELGFAETVFVDDRETGELRIFTPGVELPFAGHPLVGTAWLLRETGGGVEALRPPAGEVAVRYENGATFIAGDASWTVGFEPQQLEDAAAVRALPGAPQGVDSAYVWAWVDEAAGMIRARGFAPAFGIPEDEATGSAALALCAKLGRAVTIHQGRGSVLLCRDLGEGRAEVGGAVALDEEREFAV